MVLSLSGCDINGCPVSLGKLNKSPSGASEFYQLLAQWVRSFSGLDMILSVIYTFSSGGQVNQLCRKALFLCKLPDG